MSHAIIRRTSRLSFACIALLAILSIVAGGCNKQADQTSQEKRYHLVGKIVEVQSASNTLVVDSQEIPGFMAAMTMPYPVHYHADLAGLAEGDEITADIVVATDGAYLEKIVVTKKAAPNGGGQPSSDLRQPQPGDKVPDFVLVNQDGKQIHLSSIQGASAARDVYLYEVPIP